MNRSLVFNYLELLNILIESPTATLEEDADLSMTTNSEPTTKFAWEIKANQIYLLMINMSYLLNAYRPHQAREQLIGILQDQLSRRKSSSKTINDTIHNCSELLEQAKQLLSSQVQADQEQIQNAAELNVAPSGTKKRKREEDEDESDQEEKKLRDEIPEQELPANVLSLFEAIRQEASKK
jgi:uncharacterized membrane protein YccC